MLIWLFALALQDQIIGWTCSAERVIDGRVYRSQRAIEGQHRFPRDFRVGRTSSGIPHQNFIQWSDDEGLPDAPRTINFAVPLSERTSRAALRVVFPDGAELRVPDSPAIWTVVRLSSRTSIGQFQSLDGELNRRLWRARSFRAVVADRRGRVLGALDMVLPDPETVTRMAAELAREVDGKLNAPSDPANACSSYGEEAYVDPV